LIRHGETDWNRQRRYCGASDIGLNAKGKAQAKKLAKRLSKENIDYVYASRMKRAREFAQIVFKNRLIKKFAGLEEMNFGIFEGATHEEIVQRYPGLYQKWLDQPFKTEIPQSEGVKNFLKRVRKAWKKILSENSGKTIAVITHAGPIKLILAQILKKKFWQIAQDTAAINIVELVRGKIYLRLSNDVSYLPKRRRINHG
jgi:alpha-ribazole phosphatase